MPTVAELDVQVDANDDASATLAAIDALIKSMEGEDLRIDVETDAAQAAAELAIIREAMAAINGQDAVVEVDVEGEEAAVAAVLGVEEALERLDGVEATAEIHVEGEREAAATAAAVEARLAAIPDEEVTIEYDTDHAMASLNRLSAAALRASGTVNFLGAAILGLGPALVPLGAAAVAGVAALGGAFGIAGVAAALFGAVAVSNFKEVGEANTRLTELQKQYNQAVTDEQREAALEKMKAVMESLTPAQRAMLKGIQDFDAAWQDFAGRFEPLVFQIAAEGLRGIAGILPSLAPIVQGAGQAFLNLERAAFAALRGPFWTEFITFMGQMAQPTLEDLGRSIGNLITGFAGIVRAFMPMTSDLTQGLVNLTAAFSRWGQGLRENAAFQDFVEYVRSNIPAVMEFLGALAHAFVDLVQAAAPIGHFLIGMLTNLLQAFSRLQDAHPILATIMLAFVGLGAVLLNLIGPILAIVNIVTLLAPLFSILGSAIAAVGAFIAGLGAGVLIVIGVIAALVAGLVIAYAKIDSFREAVNRAAAAVWDFAKRAGQAIMQGLQAAWQWLVATFAPAVQAVIDYVIAEFNKMVAWAQSNAGTFIAAWENIKNAVSTAMQFLGVVIAGGLAYIKALWTNIWPGLSSIVQGAWTIISGVISAALNTIRALIQIFSGVIAGDWSAVWDGLKMLVQSAWTIITSTVRGGWQIIVGLFQLLGGQIKTLWGAVWQLLPQPVQTALSFVGTLISTGWSLITTLFSTGVAVIRALWSAFWAVFGPPVQAAWAIVQAVTSAGWAVLRALFTTGAAVLQAVWSAAWTVISTLVQAAWATIRAVVTAGWNAVMAVIRPGLAVLRSLWTTVWNAVRTVTTTVTAAIRATVTGWISALTTAITSFVSNIQARWNAFWNAVRTTAVTMINSVRSAITSGLSAVTAAIVSFISSAVSRFTSGFARIVSAVTSAMSRFRSAISSGISAAVSAITSGVGRMVSAVAGAAGRFFSAGANLMSSLARGITSRIGAAVGAVQGAVGKLTSLLPGSPAETGPLSGRGYALYRGQHLAEDLARGIRGETDLVERATRDLADLMTLQFDGRAAFDAITRGVRRPAVTGDPAGAGRGGITVQVAPGAVVVQVGGGVSLAEARQQFEGSAERLADELLTAIRRR